MRMYTQYWLLRSEGSIKVRNIMKVNITALTRYIITENSPITHKNNKKRLKKLSQKKWSTNFGVREIITQTPNPELWGSNFELII
jgi:hypothetical protein